MNPDPDWPPRPDGFNTLWNNECLKNKTKDNCENSDYFCKWTSNISSPGVPASPNDDGTITDKELKDFIKELKQDSLTKIENKIKYAARVVLSFNFKCTKELENIKSTK